jgi:hypothetical protein
MKQGGVSAVALSLPTWLTCHQPLPSTPVQGEVARQQEGWVSCAPAGLAGPLTPGESEWVGTPGQHYCLVHP